MTRIQGRGNRPERPAALNPDEARQQLIEARARLDTFAFHTAAFDYYSPLQRLRRHLEEHPEDFIGLKEAAAIGGQERHYFCTFFREKVGVSFAVWNSYRRMTRAFITLATVDETITTIAEICGFADLRTFERHCMRWTGIMPKTVRALSRAASNGIVKSDAKSLMGDETQAGRNC
jgi:AraC-like DNA-binding protein